MHLTKKFPSQTPFFVPKTKIRDSRIQIMLIHNPVSQFSSSCCQIILSQNFQNISAFMHQIRLAKCANMMMKNFEENLLPDNLEPTISPLPPSISCVSLLYSLFSPRYVKHLRFNLCLNLWYLVLVNFLNGKWMFSLWVFNCWRFSFLSFI